MAIIKAVNSKANLNTAINYITNKEKTEEKLVSGKDCTPYTAVEEMKATKELYNKTGGRQYKHYIQSFNPNDTITPQKAHDIGQEWANKNFKGYEVLIATHKDKKHIHNHFIVNSVSFKDGKKYHEKKSDLEKLKEQSDKICEREGLSVVKEKSKDMTTFNQKKYQVFKRIENDDSIKSYVLNTAIKVTDAIENSKNKQSFIKNMEDQGYKVNWKDNLKYITFTTPNGKKVRNSNLEKTFKDHKYSKEGLLNELSRTKGKHRKNTTKRRTEAIRINRSTIKHDCQNDRTKISERLSPEVFGTVQQEVRNIKKRADTTIRLPNRDSKPTPTIQPDVKQQHGSNRKQHKPKSRKRDFEIER